MLPLSPDINENEIDGLHPDRENPTVSMLRFLSPNVEPERIKSYVHETESNKIMTSTAQIHLFIDKLVQRMQPDGSFGVQPARHCLT
jgi:hypothetical protein